MADFFDPQAQGASEPTPQGGDLSSVFQGMGAAPAPNPIQALLAQLSHPDAPQPSPTGGEKMDPLTQQLMLATQRHDAVQAQLKEMLTKMQSQPPIEQVLQEQAKNYQSQLEQNQVASIAEKQKKYGTAGLALMNLLRAPGQLTVQENAKESAKQDFQAAMKQAQTQLQDQRAAQQQQVQNLQQQAAATNPVMFMLQKMVGQQGFNQNAIATAGDLNTPDGRARLSGGEGKGSGPAANATPLVVQRPVAGKDVLAQDPEAKDLKGNPLDPAKWYQEHIDRASGKVQGYDVTSAPSYTVPKVTTSTRQEWKDVGVNDKGEKVYQRFDASTSRTTGPKLTASERDATDKAAVAPVTPAGPVAPKVPGTPATTPGQRTGALSPQAFKMNAENPLTPEGQRTIVEVNNNMASIDAAIKAIAPLKDINTPGYFAPERGAYWAGLATKYTPLINNIEMERVLGAGNLLKSSGGVRALAALKQAEIHTPVMAKDSPQMIYEKLQNMKQRFQTFGKDVLESERRNPNLIRSIPDQTGTANPKDPAGIR